MNKNKLAWLWGAIVIMAISMICLMLYPSIIFSETFRIGCFYLVLEGIVLLATCGILRKIRLIASWNFAMYLAIVVAVSLAVNFLTAPAVKSEHILVLTLIIFPPFAFINFWLSKITFGISIRNACLAGILMGSINTLLCILATPVYFAGH